MADGSERFAETMERNFAIPKHSGGVNKHELADALRDAITDAHVPLVQRLDKMDGTLDWIKARLSSPEK